ncbi:MAG: PAS domain-containing protein [Halothiobacillaceae bacterium]
MIDRPVTGHEIILSSHDTIQSRTDNRGVITFANPTFARISGYSREELVGSPHNIVRHPNMPRGVYYALWQIIQAGEEFFGFVNNRCKNGDNYWVFTRVDSHYNSEGDIDAYSSVRIMPKREAVASWSKVYDRIVAIEQAQPRDKQVAAGYQALLKHIRKSGAKNLTELAMRDV